VLGDRRRPPLLLLAAASPAAIAEALQCCNAHMHLNIHCILYIISELKLHVARVRRQARRKGATKRAVRSPEAPDSHSCPQVPAPAALELHLHCVFTADVFRLFDDPHITVVVDILVMHGCCDCKQLSEISGLKMNSVNQVVAVALAL
jgi:hypothetical protein